MKEYPEKVELNAQAFGYKTANLIEVRGLVNEFNNQHSGQIKANVPEFTAISDAEIMAHIRSHVTDFDKRWEQFCLLQEESRDLVQEAALILKDLRSDIIACFSHYHFKPELANVVHFMVRSTGGDEDRPDIANPGGNESVASDLDNISESIGIVVASYISEHSLKQRLSLGRDITARYPLSPCLIQSLVTTKNRNIELRPGVVYTDAGHTRIQSAYGHGELVVNSKGSVDNYYISPKKHIYATIKNKNIKIVPKFNAKTAKLEKQIEKNSFEEAATSSLPLEVVHYIDDLSKYIEKQYDMRMDLEFVYNPEDNVINIVQIRAIPPKKTEEKSALSNDYISVRKPDFLTGEVVTPELMAAKVIKDSSEILICDNINEGLSAYLNDKDHKIKALVIRQAAADTSHEAGMLSTKAVPVLQVSDISKVRKWVENLKENVLIIDPQHAKLFQIPVDSYKDDLIVNGLFSSTLTPFVTSIPRDLEEKEVKNVFEDMELGSHNGLMQKTLKIFGLDDKAILYKDPKLLRKALDDLGTPPANIRKVNEQKRLLTNLVKYTFRKYKRGDISANLAKNITLSAHELHQILTDYSNKNIHKDKLDEYYLNIAKKIQGMMIAQAEKGTITSSVAMEAHNVQEEQLYTAISEVHNLKEQAKEIFPIVCRFDKYILTADNKNKWQQFCLDACKSGQGQLLMSYCKRLLENELHEYILNSSFVKEFDKDSKLALENLYTKLSISLDKIEGLAQADNILQQMENQVSEWSNPENFTKLHLNFKENIEHLGNLLKFNNQNEFKEVLKDSVGGASVLNRINRMIEVIDLSIKSLQTSSQYLDLEKQEQIQRFTSMVDDFHKVMVKIVDDERVDKNNLEKRLKSINNHKNSASKKGLDLSEGFSVMESDIYQEGRDSQESFVRGIQRVNTIADIHTLVHQSAINSVLSHRKKLEEIAQQNIPKQFKEMMDYILCDKTLIPEIADTKPPQLLNMILKYPNLIAEYHMPIHIHSGYLSVSYNSKTKEYNVIFKLYGDNSEFRWEQSALEGSSLLTTLTNVELTENYVLKNNIHLGYKTKNFDELKKSINILKTVKLGTLGRLDNNVYKKLYEDRSIQNEINKKFYDINSSMSDKICILQAFLYRLKILKGENCRDQKILKRLKTLKDIAPNLLNFEEQSLQSQDIGLVKNLLDVGEEVFYKIVSLVDPIKDFAESAENLRKNDSPAAFQTIFLKALLRNVSSIDYLTAPSALDAYKQPKFGKELFEALVPPEALYDYQVNPDVLKLLTSDWAIKAYKKGVSPKLFCEQIIKNLRFLPIEFIKNTLFSDESIKLLVDNNNLSYKDWFTIAQNKFSYQQTLQNSTPTAKTTATKKQIPRIVTDADQTKLPRKI